MTQEEQAISLIEKSKSPLVITKQDPTGDSVGSMLAMYLALEKMGKKPAVVSHGNLGIIYRFLPKFHKIASGLPSSKEFVISVDMGSTSAKNLNYTLEGGKLRIFIDQDGAKLQKENVKVASGSELEHDLVIAVNCPNLDNIGKPFSENPEFFYKTTVVNLDHRAGNEQFGQVNVVDIDASSTAEVIYRLLSEINSELVDQDIATCLLTGIMADTKSFQLPGMNPNALTLASELIRKGANHGKIVQHMYKTRDLSQIRLWGKILMELKGDDSMKLTWSAVEYDDFKSTGAMPSHAEGVIDDILHAIPDTEMIMLLVEHEPGKFRGILHSNGNTDAKSQAIKLGGDGNRQRAYFDMEAGSVQEASSGALEALRAK